MVGAIVVTVCRAGAIEETVCTIIAIAEKVCTACCSIRETICTLGAIGAIIVETVCNSRNGLHNPLCNRRNCLHTGHADLATATDLHRGGKRETAWTGEEMEGRGGLRRGWFERWKGDSERGQVCLCCLIQEGGDAKNVFRTEFYEQAFRYPWTWNS